MTAPATYHAHANLRDQPIADRDRLRSQRNRLNTNRPLQLPSCYKIRMAVCRVYGLKPSQLNDTGRHKTAAEARMVAMWFFREIMKFSYPELGREFDRHHTTCISDVRRIARSRENTPLLAERMALIADELLQGIH